MKQEQLEKEVTATIKAIGNQRKAKMDTANPLLRSAIRDIILTKHSEARAKLKEKIQEEVLMEGKVTSEKLPGCRELFGDLLAPPAPLPAVTAVNSPGMNPQYYSFAQLREGQINGQFRQ